MVPMHENSMLQTNSYTQYTNNKLNEKHIPNHKFQIAYTDNIFISPKTMVKYKHHFCDIVSDSESCTLENDICGYYEKYLASIYL